MLNDLEVLVENASELAAQGGTDFAMIRRVGFGASDASVLLGVNKWNSKSDLIKQKASKTITDDELAVGQMVNVRKGSDLEPLIMQKFQAKYDMDLIKPSAMYKVPGTRLTVNFDGVGSNIVGEFPVEIKFVSTYAAKFWGTSKEQGDRLDHGGEVITEQHTTDIKEHIKHHADLCGIPDYYYTQVQQQLYALGADYGFLCALFDKDWQIHTFKIARDQVTIDALVAAAEEAWEEVAYLKGTMQFM